MNDTLPRILTKKDLAIPSWAEPYVLMVKLGDEVTFYVEQAHTDTPATRQLLKALANRGFPNVVKKPVSIEELKALRATHDSGKATADTVSGQRRVIELLKQCLRAGASDGQLKQYKESAGVRLRIHGSMTSFGAPIIKSDIEQLCMTLFYMSDKNSRTGNYSPDAPNDAAILHRLAEFGLADMFAAIRLTFNPTLLGPECDMRFQPANQTARELDAIGLPAETLTTIQDALAEREGAILVSGSVGSGKTNLLASMVKYYNACFPGRKIQTIEDPVEIFISDTVSQWQLTGNFEDRGDGYLYMLNRTLRADAQMVMLQEMRDAAAAKAFFRLAITGALALSTIHASHPLMIPARLKDLGISRFHLTSPDVIRILAGVHLIPVLCKDCKIPLTDALATNPSLPRVLNRLRRFAQHAHGLRGSTPPDLDGICITRKEGCPSCQGEGTIIRDSYGTTGRVQVAEVIRPDDTLLEHCYEERMRDATHHLRTVLKVPSLREHALELIAAGIVSPIDAELAIGPFPTVNTLESVAA